MGGCASKPKELKAVADAPAPLDEPSTVSDPTAGEKEEEIARGGEAEHPDDSRRRSLGVLFREKEESGGAPSETDENAVKDATATAVVEPVGEAEQPKTQDHPTEGSEPIVAAVTDEQPVDSSLKAEAKPVEGEAADTGNGVGEEGSSVSEEKKGDAELPA